MKLDCIAFVNNRNETLLTRSAHTPMDRIEAEVVALMQRYEEPVFALRSYTDMDGKEVRPAIYTRAALDARGALLEVEIWLARTPNFFAAYKEGDSVPKGDFDLAGVLIVPAGADGEVLEDGFRYSQNIDHAWNPVKGCRSGSVGDVFVIRKSGAEDQKAFAVASFGFTPVTFA